MAKLIAADIAIQITLGGPVSLAGPTWLTAQSVITMCKSVHLTEGLSKVVDVAALADGLDKDRPQRSNFTVDLDLLVDATLGTLTDGKVGNYIRVDLKSLSSLTSYSSYVGYISERDHEASDGDAQKETVKVKGGVDGYTYTGMYS